MCGNFGQDFEFKFMHEKFIGMIRKTNKFFQKQEIFVWWFTFFLLYLKVSRKVTIKEKEKKLPSHTVELAQDTLHFLNVQIQWLSWADECYFVFLQNQYHKWKRNI